MTKKTRYIIIFSILIITWGVLGFFGWKVYKKKQVNNMQQVNYLIPGVPYYGFYNHYFDANSLAATSMADNLGYWGDGVNLPDLLNTFIKKDEKGNRTYPTILEIKNFFQEKGYETYSWTANEPGGEINEIKKFVNPDKKIPVIVFQKQSTDPTSSTREFRVVIGVFDNQQKVIVHDHDFGNNYEISYQDFESMFKPDARTILAVWPKAELASKLRGPDYSKQYPKRLQAMDDLGELLVRGAEAVRLFNKGEYEQSLQLYQEFITDLKFSHFPPAHQVSFYTFLAQIYSRMDKMDEAIKVINEKALPINHNLSQSYGEWGSPVNADRFWGPYNVLGMIYQKKGDKELAKNNFEEVLKINPGYGPAQKALEQLK